jgi:sarcosine oxidase
MASYDVAVIGLGAMGSAALHALARRGQRVIGFDRFVPGHDRGSSHGESRIIRLAYFEGEAYVPLVRAALDLWRGLEAATGEKVFTNCGVLEMGESGSSLVASSLASARLHDLAIEELSGRDVARRFPAFAPDEDWDCIFQPDGGLLEPEKAIAAMVRAAEALGAEVRPNLPTLRPEPVGGHVRIRLEDGRTLEAGAVIVAAGAWMPELYPELAALQRTCQHLFWFEPRARELARPDRMPAFVMEADGHCLYGLPDIGSGVKTALHEPGPVLASADAPRPDPQPEITRTVAELTALRIPAAAGPLRRVMACTYTNAPDGHFVIGLHPDEPKVVLASPCSGHGFKFATVIGEILADLAMRGETGHPIGLFAPERLR